MLHKTMNRRCDTWTAEKIEMGLLTRAAFNGDAALRYGELAGLPSDLIMAVLSRPADQVRRYQNHLGGVSDRRTRERP